MGKILTFKDYTIEEVVREDGMEVNFLVKTKGDKHVCQLVSWEDGFDIAPKIKSVASLQTNCHGSAILLTATMNKSS